jgi:hypothetical protein
MLRHVDPKCATILLATVRKNERGRAISDKTGEEKVEKSLSQVYRETLDDFEKRYPQNEALLQTTKDVLRQMREEAEVKTNLDNVIDFPASRSGAKGTQND